MKLESVGIKVGKSWTKAKKLFVGFSLKLHLSLFLCLSFLLLSLLSFSVGKDGPVIMKTSVP